MAIARTIPAVIAALLLGAHFLRADASVPMIACLALIPVLFVDGAGARLFSRLALAAGVVLWVVTAWRIAEVRLEAGRPYLRMLTILGGVAAFTAVAAWLLPPARPDERPDDDD